MSSRYFSLNKDLCIAGNGASRRSVIYHVLLYQSRCNTHWIVVVDFGT